MFAQMKKACNAASVKDVPWARADISRAGEMPNHGDVEAFVKKTTERIQKRLKELTACGEEKVGGVLVLGVGIYGGER